MARKRRAEPQAEVTLAVQPVDQNQGQAKPEYQYRPAKLPDTFDQWYQSKCLPNHLKTVIKHHFESYGFAASGEFEKGLKHYGL